MDFILLENAAEIRDAFMDRFVLSWEAFQVQRKDWIAEMAKTNYPITEKWYNHAFMWDRMAPEHACISLEDALAFLREHNGRVRFMGEEDEETAFHGKELMGFVAEADARALAARIEREWFGWFRLAKQNMYDPDAFLPDDLYVFDPSMNWCVVFTHETAVWESETTDWMEAAQSRCCILCK